MPSLIETAIYALTAVIVFAVVGSIYVLATTEAAESKTGDGLTPTPERRYREAQE